MDGFFGGHKVGEEVAGKRLVAYAGMNKHRHHAWTWECINCGRVSGPSTYSHLKRSIRCIGCNVGENSGRWKGYKELTGVWLGQYAYGAKKRGIAWDVTPEQLWDLWISQDGKCAYTGRQLKHGVDASLDRIDNSKGYIPGNIQLGHPDINRMKSEFDASYSIKLCEEVSRNQQN